MRNPPSYMNGEFHMWEEKVHIYNTPRVYNNFSYLGGYIFISFCLNSLVKLLYNFIIHNVASRQFYNILSNLLFFLTHPEW